MCGFFGSQNVLVKTKASVLDLTSPSRALVLKGIQEPLVPVGLSLALVEETAMSWKLETSSVCALLATRETAVRMASEEIT